MNVENCLLQARKMLSHLDSCFLDANLIMSYVLKQDLSYLLINNKYILEKSEKSYFFSLIRRRSRCEPIAYIIKQKEFFSRKFFIDKNVLIPRPDTEILVEKVMKKCNDCSKDSINILDLGTGSGVIAITLALELKNIKPFIVATDINHNIINIAKKNGKTYSVENISFICSDLFRNLSSYLGYFDLIVSNPPYIDKKFEKKSLSRDITMYEPKKALYAINKGLFFFQKIAHYSRFFLKKNGCLFLEINSYKKNSIERILKNAKFNVEEVYYDLQNLPRVIQAELA